MRIIQTQCSNVYISGAKCKWVLRTFYCNAILMSSVIRVLHLCMTSWSWVGENCGRVVQVMYENCEKRARCDGSRSRRSFLGLRQSALYAFMFTTMMDMLADWVKQESPQRLRTSMWSAVRSGSNVEEDLERREFKGEEGRLATSTWSTCVFEWEGD